MYKKSANFESNLVSCDVVISTPIKEKCCVTSLLFYSGIFDNIHRKQRHDTIFQRSFFGTRILREWKAFFFFFLCRICLTTDGGGFLSQREGRRNPDLSSFSRKGIGGSIISQTFGPEAAFPFPLDKFVLMPGWKAVLFPSPPLQFWNQGNEAGGGGRGEERREEAKSHWLQQRKILRWEEGEGKGRERDDLLSLLFFPSSSSSSFL